MSESTFEEQMDQLDGLLCTNNNQLPSPRKDHLYNTVKRQVLVGRKNLETSETMSASSTGSYLNTLKEEPGWDPDTVHEAINRSRGLEKKLQIGLSKLATDISTMNRRNLSMMSLLNHEVARVGRMREELQSMMRSHSWVLSAEDASAAVPPTQNLGHDCDGAAANQSEENPANMSAVTLDDWQSLCDTSLNDDELMLPLPDVSSFLEPFCYGEVSEDDHAQELCCARVRAGHGRPVYFDEALVDETELVASAGLDDSSLSHHIPSVTRDRGDDTIEDIQPDAIGSILDELCAEREKYVHEKQAAEDARLQRLHSINSCISQASDDLSFLCAYIPLGEAKSDGAILTSTREKADYDGSGANKFDSEPTLLDLTSSLGTNNSNNGVEYFGVGGSGTGPVEETDKNNSNNNEAGDVELEGEEVDLTSLIDGQGSDEDLLIVYFQRLGREEVDDEDNYSDIDEDLMVVEGDFSQVEYQPVVSLKAASFMLLLAVLLAAMLMIRVLYPTPGSAASGLVIPASHDPLQQGLHP